MDGDKELGKINPFRYRSYYFDEEIGMYYLQSRYYDAEIGRFINADDVNIIPTMQSGIKGTNLFEYCDDNPVNKEDRTGHWSFKLSNYKLWQITAVAGFLGVVILGIVVNIALALIGVCFIDDDYAGFKYWCFTAILVLVVRKIGKVKLQCNKAMQ